MFVAGMFVIVFFFAHRDYAAMGCLTNFVFQLDRRVLDAETLSEFLVDFAEDRIAF